MPSTSSLLSSRMAGLLPGLLAREGAGLVDQVAGLAIPEPEPSPQAIVADLAGCGLLTHCVPPLSEAGEAGALPIGRLCLLRAALAYRSPLYDLMFVMQGLGSHAVAQAGTPEQRRAYLPLVAAGTALAALGLTEPEAGSDLAGIATRARKQADGSYRIDGEKVFISNAGLATHYVLYARTDDHPKRGLSAFLLPAATPGVHTSPLRLLCDDHPIGRLTLSGVVLPAEARIGPEGAGMSLAFATLARFRPTVGAAAVGMAARALDEAIAHVRRRTQFGQPLASFQATQLRIAEMATELQAAALLVQHAAERLDAAQAGGHEPDGSESAMAKLFATEVSQRVVDAALQLHGGSGLLVGSVIERLYRDVRALRIYEGTSEIQKLIIARSLLREPGR
ncbi:MAG TPA: acyl-CoA dehydrogenase family protein [Pseudomonadota bacterium]|nr:acyl-CoA dehydrogenase family protein [Pseudomonadota bacterium]